LNQPFVKIALSYDGTDFAGWQVQPGQETIQGCLENAIEKQISSKVRIIGSGRTDAGVHAVEQIASFALPPGYPIETFHPGLNSLLPPTIRVLDAQLVDNFHALRDATGKEYCYYLSLADQLHPLAQRFCWRPVVNRKIKVSAIQHALPFLTGTHDFASFCAAGSDSQTTVRTINSASIEELSKSDRPFPKSSMYCLRFQGNGFLKQMVRNVVGTLIEIGQRKIEPTAIKEIIEAKDRRAAGPTAPAHGLFLNKVFYSQTLGNFPSSS
jgi:tRNA pseudouridine38-40 synthase